MRRIIFVCSGNICRSPMAEVIAQRAFKDAQIPAHVISMGTLGIFGRPASEYGVQACERRGMDLSRHSSQGVSLGILEKADVVVVMEKAHRDFLLKHRPGLKNVRLFSFFEDGGESDVPDPMGKAPEDYEECCDRICAGVEGLVRAFRLGLL